MGHDELGVGERGTQHAGASGWGACRAEGLSTGRAHPQPFILAPGSRPRIERGGGQGEEAVGATMGADRVHSGTRVRLDTWVLATPITKSR
jgi:hypothetical protein